jgi:hypothetical protein
MRRGAEAANSSSRVSAQLTDFFLLFLFRRLCSQERPQCAPLRGDRVIGWWRDNAFLYPFPIYLYRQSSEKKEKNLVLFLSSLTESARGANFATHILLFAFIVIFCAARLCTGIYMLVFCIMSIWSLQVFVKLSHIFAADLFLMGFILLFADQ